MIQYRSSYRYGRRDTYKGHVRQHCNIFSSASDNNGINKPPLHPEHQHQQATTSSVPINSVDPDSLPATMSSRTILAIAMLASNVIAVPFGLAELASISSTEPRNVTRRSGGGPDHCGPTSGDQLYAADIYYYTDKDCSDAVGSNCAYAARDKIDGGPGKYECEGPTLPAHTPYWAKLVDTDFPNIQVVYTQDQTCPPSGPGAVFAVLDNNANCVQMNKGGPSPGVSIFPHGGSGLARKVEKRDTECSGFRIDSQQSSESRSIQISDIVDCTNGSEAGCTISIGEEHTESLSTSFSFTSGVTVAAIFEVSTTFGVEYTSSSTTSIQTGLSIPAGQKGYLSAYNTATLFRGHFTGCNSGDSEQAGVSLVLKEGGMTYSIILTGA